MKKAALSCIAKKCYCLHVARNKFRYVFDEAGSTFVAFRTCTHGPRFLLLMRFLFGMKIEHLPYLYFHQYGNIDRCIIIYLYNADIALWQFKYSQCSLHSPYAYRSRPYIMLLCGRDPLGRPQLIHSNSYSVTLEFQRGFPWKPPGYATASGSTGW